MFAVYNQSNKIARMVLSERFETEEQANRFVTEKIFDQKTSYPHWGVIDLDEEELAPHEMTNEELAQHITDCSEWDHDALQELCGRANLLEEYEAGCCDGCAYEDSFEYVVEKAAKTLGVADIMGYDAKQCRTEAYNIILDVEADEGASVSVSLGTYEAEEEAREALNGFHSRHPDRKYTLTHTVVEILESYN